jgi:hypothetical protein
MSRNSTVSNILTLTSSIYLAVGSTKLILSALFSRVSDDVDQDVSYRAEYKTQNTRDDTSSDVEFSKQISSVVKKTFSFANKAGITDIAMSIALGCAADRLSSN